MTISICQLSEITVNTMVSIKWISLGVLGQIIEQDCSMVKVDFCISGMKYLHYFLVIVSIKKQKTDHIQKTVYITTYMYMDIMTYNYMITMIGSRIGSYPHIHHCVHITVTLHKEQYVFRLLRSQLITLSLLSRLFDVYSVTSAGKYTFSTYYPRFSFVSVENAGK